MADIGTNTPRLPSSEDESRFWALLEHAWAGRGPEMDRQRRELASRSPGAEVDAGPVETALKSVLADLARECRGCSSEELTDLDRVVERKLHDLDRADVHAVTDGSDDGFLYARGFVVALGRDFHDAVVHDPNMAVPDAECEEMCYFFAHLHHQRFGKFPATGSGISRASCTNRAGWAS